MFTPEKMTRVLIAATRSQMEPVIRELYRQNVFHIEDFVEKDSREYEGYRIGTPLPAANETSRELIRLRGITSSFGIREDEEIPADRKVDAARLRQVIERELPLLEQETEELLGKKTRIDAQIREYEQKIEALRPFQDVPFDISLLRGFHRFSVLCGYVAKVPDLKMPHEIFTAETKKGKFIILIVPQEMKASAEQALLDVQFQAVALPDEEGVPSERMGFYEGQILTRKGELEEINRKLEEIRTKHHDLFLACHELLTADVEMAEAPLRFATTGRSFVVEGWVPTAHLERLKEGIHYATGGKVFVYECKPDEFTESPPTEYRNPGFAKPTEMLMDIYSRPKYTELDPTLLVSIIFPIFFGIILGDVGYGAVLLALSLALHRVLRSEDGRRLAIILRNGSLSSIFFGVLFSEFFGFALPWDPVLFSRHLNIGGHAGGHGPDVTGLMIMAIWIGVLQITLGRVFGMVNHARQDHGAHRVKAVLANLGWIMVLWGILFSIWSSFSMPLMPDFTGMPPVAAGMNATMIGGLSMIVLGVLFIVMDSPLEVVELPTIMSHVLSYARLVGVGLSSVAIAMVVNFIAIGLIIEPQLESPSALGAVIIVIGGIVLVVGHILNTVLGMLGGALQSLRLQYVEFFTKFYKGGGRKYTPFGMRKKFVED
ncbi:MAG: V-type ATP synthase subunit I [Methanolinea sp.]|nr:V-type ATP synthase subunit I [Methanolinea sp.]